MGKRRRRNRPPDMVPVSTSLFYLMLGVANIAISVISGVWPLGIFAAFAVLLGAAGLVIHVVQRRSSRKDDAS